MLIVTKTYLSSPLVCKKPRLLCCSAIEKGLEEALSGHMGYFIPSIAVFTQIEGWVNRIQHKWPKRERKYPILTGDDLLDIQICHATSHLDESIYS